MSIFEVGAPFNPGGRTVFYAPFVPMLVESLKWRLSRDKRASVLGIPFYGLVSALCFVFWFCSFMILFWPFCFIVSFLFHFQRF